MMTTHLDPSGIGLSAESRGDLLIPSTACARCFKKETGDLAAWACSRFGLVTCTEQKYTQQKVYRAILSGENNKAGSYLITVP